MRPFLLGIAVGCAVCPVVVALTLLVPSASATALAPTTGEHVATVDGARVWRIETSDAVCYALIPGDLACFKKVGSEEIP